MSKNPPLEKYQICLMVADGEQQITYHSLTSGESSRWIAPHALAYSQGRWYIRAWSRERNDFRDFNINRIENVVGARSVEISTDLDYEWNTFFDLVLQPNPQLDEDTRQWVAAEYEMTDDRIVVSVRLSLIFYVMSEHNLDVAPGILPPQKQQLVLINRDEVEAARSVARKMSSDALKRAVQR